MDERTSQRRSAQGTDAAWATSPTMTDGHRTRERGLSPAVRPLLLALLPLIGACGSKERAPPPYEANPSPKEAYEVVVTTHDAPEEMYVTSASATYKIADEGCMPPIRNFEGVRYGENETFLPLSLRRVDATTFTGVLYADGMLNADYFGRGVCTWSFQLVDVKLETEHTRTFTYFQLGASLGKPQETRYARKETSTWENNGRPQLANDLSQEQYDQKLNGTDREDYFSYHISINSRMIKK